MAYATSLVSILGRINPAIYDVIFPHGPILSSFTGLGRAATVVSELNPQPLPPKDELLMASAAVARDIAFAAINAEAGGQDNASRIVTTAIDDWCGNGRPPIPIPWPGPYPFPFALEAVPHDLDVAAARVVGALSLAAVASRLAPSKVREALSTGADKLLEIGLGSAQKSAAAGR